LQFRYRGSRREPAVAQLFSLGGLHITHIMKLFTTLDDQFMQLADDDSQRASALARLKTRRASYYIGGLAFIVAGVILKLTGNDMGFSFPFIGLAFLCVAFKHESDIRTLQMVQHLRERYDKPVA
jgi:hypothetical protein